MDLAGLQKKLVAAARSNSPGEQVPYGFEARLMARLRAVPKIDEWAWWSRALWRSAAACVALTLLLSVWSLISFQGTSSGAASADLEEVVLASVDDADLGW